MDLEAQSRTSITSLIHLLLHIVNAKPGDDIHIHWPIPVGFQVVVEGLRLIASLVEQVGQSRQHTCRVSRDVAATRRELRVLPRVKKRVAFARFSCL